MTDEWGSEELLEWIEGKLEYIESRKRKPGHGICCTCQRCGHVYDDCICGDEQAYEQIKALIKASFNLRNKSLMRLAETLGISFSAAKIISDHALIQGHPNSEQSVAQGQGKQATEEFVEKWADELYYADYHMPEKELKEAIGQMLKEAGYQIGAKITEEWIGEKAEEMIEIISNYCFSVGELGNARPDATRFIRSLVEECTCLVDMAKG